MSNRSNGSIGVSLRSLIPYFMRKKKAGFSRRHERYACVAIGVMKVIEIGAEFDGVITELSQGGCAFRLASMYTLDRSNELVMIRTEDFEAEGRIRAVRPDSYGIQFFEDLDQALIGKILAEHGGKIGDSFLAKRH